MRQFGKLPEKEKARIRPGSYAVIERDEKILVVQIIGWGEYFLPGGGIDPGESEEEALKREALEETGYSITINNKIGTVADYIYFSPADRWYNKIGHFYIAESGEQDIDLIIEEDHKTVWLPIKEAAERLHLGGHRWAVMEYIAIK